MLWKARAISLQAHRTKGVCAAALFAFYPAWSQDLSYATFTGVVKEAETGVPIAHANVFIANTTLGAATDEVGFFQITHVPLGAHELVASIIGYETQTRSIRAIKPIEQKQDFSLKPKTLQAAEVEVIAEQPREWRRNLKKFEEVFWGHSRHISACKIINPEILDFNTPPGTSWLTASATQLMQVENKGLGYRMDILLVAFKYDLRDEAIQYRIIPRFEALTSADELEEQRWQKNRLQAYYGSLRHFFRALISDRLAEEKFRLFSMPAFPWLTERPEHKPITSKELLVARPLPFEREMRLPGYLEVRYYDDKEGEQISWLDSFGYVITLHTLGYVTGPFEVMVYGYWSGQRVAEMLPQDYEPYK